MGTQPLIIECRCNETAYRGANPHLPYSPDEIVREAVRAWEAGAAIFHWHGRNPQSGVPQNDLELYLQVYEGIRAHTDLIIHPTLGYITQPRVEDRVRHILAVQDDPRLRVDMVPVDFGSLNVDYWNPVERRFTTTDQVYVNTRANLEAVLRVFQQHHLFVAAVCWDVGQIRTARCFQAMGLVSERTLWEFVFTGETMPTGTPVTLPSLQSMIAEVPTGQPWLVLCWNGDVLPVAAWAITLGGHVAIGLGDYAYSRFGTPHNGELVARVAAMAETLGRPLATPGQARALLGIPDRPELPRRSTQ